jgi:hypothetical protein
MAGYERHLLANMKLLASEIGADPYTLKYHIKPTATGAFAAATITCFNVTRAGRYHGSGEGGGLDNRVEDIREARRRIHGTWKFLQLYMEKLLYLLFNRYSMTTPSSSIYPSPTLVPKPCCNWHMEGTTVKQLFSAYC